MRESAINKKKGNAAKYRLENGMGMGMGIRTHTHTSTLSLASHRTTQAIGRPCVGRRERDSIFKIIGISEKVEFEGQTVV